MEEGTGSRPSNREVGNVWMAYILQRLYDEWPARVDLNYMDAQTATNIDGGWGGEDLFKDLLLWLRDQGFIAFDDDGYYGAVSNASLTLRGMAVLRTPDDDSKEPLGQKLRSITATIGSEVGRAGLSKLLDTVLNAALKSLSG